MLLGHLKLLGLLERNDFLVLTNAIFAPLTNVTIVGIAGLVEIAVGLVALVSRKQLTGAWLLLWLSCGMMAYKLGLALVGYKGPCGCLLGITRLVPLPTGLQREIADYLGFWFLGSSLYVVISDRLCRFRRPPLPQPAAVEVPGP